MWKSADAVSYEIDFLGRDGVAAHARETRLTCSLIRGLISADFLKRSFRPDNRPGSGYDRQMNPYVTPVRDLWARCALLDALSRAGNKLNKILPRSTMAGADQGRPRMIGDNATRAQVLRTATAHVRGGGGGGIASRRVLEDDSFQPGDVVSTSRGLIDFREFQSGNERPAILCEFGNPKMTTR
jgi:hypothetical protein